MPTNPVITRDIFDASDYMGSVPASTLSQPHVARQARQVRKWGLDDDPYQEQVFALVRLAEQLEARPPTGPGAIVPWPVAYRIPTSKGGATYLPVKADRQPGVFAPGLHPVDWSIDNLYKGSGGPWRATGRFWVAVGVDPEDVPAATVEVIAKRDAVHLDPLPNLIGVTEARRMLSAEAAKLRVAADTAARQLPLHPCCTDPLRRALDKRRGLMRAEADRRLFGPGEINSVLDHAVADGLRRFIDPDERPSVSWMSHLTTDLIVKLPRAWRALNPASTRSQEQKAIAIAGQIANGVAPDVDVDAADQQHLSIEGMAAASPDELVSVGVHSEPEALLLEALASLSRADQLFLAEGFAAIGVAPGLASVASLARVVDYVSDALLPKTQRLPRLSGPSGGTEQDEVRAGLFLGCNGIRSATMRANQLGALAAGIGRAADLNDVDADRLGTQIGWRYRDAIAAATERIGDPGIVASTIPRIAAGLIALAADGYGLEVDGVALSRITRIAAGVTVDFDHLALASIDRARPNQTDLLLGVFNAGVALRYALGGSLPRQERVLDAVASLAAPDRELLDRLLVVSQGRTDGEADHGFVPTNRALWALDLARDTAGRRRCDLTRAVQYQNATAPVVEAGWIREAFDPAELEDVAKATTDWRKLFEWGTSGARMTL